jgi:MoxR-like ATPase
VKGKADDLPVYALLGQHQVRSRFEVVAQHGLTQFVERYPELQRLLAALMQAERVEGQVVSVVGEAGIGKSRLLHEFKQHLVLAAGITQRVPLAVMSRTWRAFWFSCMSTEWVSDAD